MPLPAIPAKLIKLVQLAILIALFILLWRTMDGREAVRVFLDADLWWILAAALALTAQTLLSAQRWRLTASQLGIDIRPARALGEYYLAQFVNQSLPGGVVGDAGRAVRSRAQAGLSMAAQAVIYERLAGQFGLLAIFLVGLCFSVFLPAGFAWPDWLIWPVALGLAAVALAPVVVVVMKHNASPFAEPVTLFANRLYRALAAPEVRLAQTALSLATAVCNLASFAFCAIALGVTLPILTVITLVPIILFSMLLPLTIGGWGVREGAAALLFPLVGASASQGLATSVAFGLVIAASVLPGLGITWFAARDADP